MANSRDWVVGSALLVDVVTLKKGRTTDNAGVSEPTKKSHVAFVDFESDRRSEFKYGTGQID